MHLALPHRCNLLAHEGTYSCGNASVHVKWGQIEITTVACQMDGHQWGPHMCPLI
jgi:hypothetical protein